MSDQSAIDLIHWVKELVKATEDATQGAERRHQEIMRQREELFEQEQYNRGFLVASAEGAA